MNHLCGWRGENRGGLKWESKELLESFLYWSSVEAEGGFCFQHYTRKQLCTRHLSYPLVQSFLHWCPQNSWEMNHVRPMFILRFLWLTETTTDFEPLGRLVRDVHSFSHSELYFKVSKIMTYFYKKLKETNVYMRRVFKNSVKSILWNSDEIWNLSCVTSV